MIQVPFGEFLPDQPSLGNPGSTLATNVLPMQSHYRPIKGLEVYSNALEKRAQGAIGVTKRSGEVYVFAGDADKLYRINRISAPNFENVAKEGGYKTPDDRSWQFTQFGDKILATNFIDPIQSFDMESSETFTDLGGTPPKAHHLAVINNFVVVGNTWDETDGHRPNRVRWSAIDNAENWAISASTQSDFQDLQGEGGRIQAVIGGDYGVIIQERSIWRMTYVGSPLVFQFEEVEKNRGTLTPNSVVHVGGNVFYLGESGFYMFNGQSSVPIGANKVDEYFLKDMDRTYLPNLTAAADPVNKLVYWSYTGQGHTGGRANKLLVYNWELGTWASGELETEGLFRSVTMGESLDSMDTISASLDDIAYSLDSTIWMGGAPVLAAFDTNHCLSFFNGNRLDSVLETKEIALGEGERTHVQGVRPILDGGTATVQIGSREGLNENVTWSDPIALNNIGIADCRSNARYHRFRVNLDGDWNTMQGLEVLLQNTGRQ